MLHFKRNEPYQHHHIRKYLNSCEGTNASNLAKMAENDFETKDANPVPKSFSIPIKRSPIPIQKVQTSTKRFSLLANDEKDLTDVELSLAEELADETDQEMTDVRKKSRTLVISLLIFFIGSEMF